MADVTVLIPTWNPDKRLDEILRRLSKQTALPSRILIMNTADGDDDSQVLDIVDRYRDSFPVLSVFHVDRKDFDHGGTRKLGMTFAHTEFVLCMTQDAVPRDSHLTERLLEPFSDPLVAVSYARQLPLKSCSEAERYTRTFNYPEDSCVKSLEDIGRLGIKTFFCSDVCAMWRKETYDGLGGFEAKTIFNEDMILAGKLVKAGYRIAYRADAMVWHSHSYSPLQQLRRNFDLGVSQADHPEIFSQVSSTGEGVKLVRETCAYLVKTGYARQIPKLVFDSGCKYAGYILGKNYRKLPENLILRLTGNRQYWRT